jgi:hypothetical protein
MIGLGLVALMLAACDDIAGATTGTVIRKPDLGYWTWFILLVVMWFVVLGLLINWVSRHKHDD